jgi:phospholipase/carboxylesterase
MNSTWDDARAEPPIEIETGPAVAASVIWLHGLGADGNDFVPIVRELQLPERPFIRFLFPHAPFRAVTINGGYVMRAWYDLGIGPTGLQQNREHLHQSEQVVVGLVRREISRGVSPSQIVLAGFSQGGAVALRAGLRFQEALAGILALSAPVPDAAELMAEVNAANELTPLFLAHGYSDQVVPFKMGEMLRNQASARGLAMQWNEYDMAHSVCEDEIRDIAAWLGRVLSS